MLQVALLLVLCYLIGSIPFPVLVSRLVRGIDLREHGSGNMGAANAGRVLGRRWFAVVFVLDALKGAGAAWLAVTFLPPLPGSSALFWAAVGGATAVLGHCYPMLAGFRGGLGLATSAGALGFLSLSLMLAALASIGLFWVVTRNMYTGVAATALLFPPVSWFWLRALDLAAVIIVWGLVVFVRHLPDVRKWLAGLRR